MGNRLRKVKWFAQGHTASKEESRIFRLRAAGLKAHAVSIPPHSTYSALQPKETSCWYTKGAFYPNSRPEAPTSLPSTSCSWSAFLAMNRHEYGHCRLLNGPVVPVHYYCTFTICLIPFPQITRALLIMFPWGEQLLIGKESGKIREHWLLKYIKYSFLRQRKRGEKGHSGQGEEGPSPRWATPLSPEKGTRLELLRICKTHCFSFLFSIEMPS